MDEYFLISAIEQYLPTPQHRYPNGFTNFDCPVCIDFGEPRPDTRQRCGIKAEGSGFGLSCKNCGFKTRWYPGQLIGKNLELFIKNIGYSQDQIDVFKHNAWKISKFVKKPNVSNTNNNIIRKVSMPEDSYSLIEWLEAGCDDPNFLKVVSYLENRGNYLLDNYDFYWSPIAEFKNRVIIPILYNDKIVTYTARSIINGQTRYIGQNVGDVVFNMNITKNHTRRIIPVLEGPFDAMAVNGIALMGSSLNKNVSDFLKSTGKRIIVVPDNDEAGYKLASSALDYGFEISLPFIRISYDIGSCWSSDIEDSADAAKRYGRLFAAHSILASIPANRIDAKVKMGLFREAIKRNTRN